MYPHPQINSFIQDCNPQVPRKILNSTIEKGYTTLKNSKNDFNTFTSIRYAKACCRIRRVPALENIPFGVNATRVFCSPGGRDSCSARLWTLRPTKACT